MMLRLITILAFASALLAADNNFRRPESENELNRWLAIMRQHQFTVAEMKSATGLSEAEIEAALRKLPQPPHDLKRGPTAALLVLPYPGGRHPRIGFLEGAIDPQRETKLSIFTPWDDSSYVVADVPEAIWSNLGLTYLAHTHIPTVWTEQKIELPQLEWMRLPNGEYRMERTLPNGIRFGTLARGTPKALFMKMWLSNGTANALSDLRVQNCVMLKGAKGFNEQTNDNKVMRGAFAACKSKDRKRWVITAWKPLHRAWANAPVPCVHSDPKFPDTPPGATSTVHGLIAFYEGIEIEAEFERLEKLWPELEKL